MPKLSHKQFRSSKRVRPPSDSQYYPLDLQDNFASCCLLAAAALSGATCLKVEQGQHPDKPTSKGRAMANSIRLLSLMALISACGSTPDASETKLVNGVTIDSQELSFVVEINDGECTGAFISDDTLVTAGHCVAQGVTYNGVEGTTYIHRDYKHDQLINDVAVVHFDRPIAPATVPMDFRIPQVGKVATVVGFGCSNQSGIGGGVKRAGNTIIESNTDGKLKFTRRPAYSMDPLGQNIAACPGDSGGPMIVDGKLVGIASYILPHSNGITESFYASVGAQSNVDFFMRAALRGATIPGLSGANTQPQPQPNPSPFNPSQPHDSGSGSPDSQAAAHLDQIVTILNSMIMNCSIAPYGVIQGQENGHYTYTLAAFDRYGQMTQQHYFQSNFRLRRPQDSANVLVNMIPHQAFSVCTRR